MGHPVAKGQLNLARLLHARVKLNGIKKQLFSLKWLAARIALGNSPKIHFLNISCAANRKGHPDYRDVYTMRIFNRLRQIAIAAREFVAPTYHPELHYMRGPGPACARKAGQLGF
jgi:hypothetical protein